MKAVIGCILIVAGILFGVWAGVWWAFIGGIMDIINEVKSADASALNVALGVAKIVFAGLIGWCAGFIAILPGWLMVENS